VKFQERKKTLLKINASSFKFGQENRRLHLIELLVNEDFLRLHELSVRKDTKKCIFELLMLCW